MVNFHFPFSLFNCPRQSVFILDSLLIGGLRFVLDKVAAAAEAELNDDSALRERLLEAQMRLELGEIDEAQYAAIERDVLARLRELRGAQQLDVTSPGVRVRGADIDTWKGNSEA